MKKNKNLIVILLIVIAGIILYTIINSQFFKSKTATITDNFPPTGVSCFDNFAKTVNGGKIGMNNIDMPAFIFSNVTHFRCASSLGFNQYEINATDNEGHPFYLHKDEGGVAASGADTVYNLCYKKDDTII